MITSSAYDRTVRAQETVDAKVRLAARAFHANTAADAYFLVAFIAMLAASFANQSTAFTVVTVGAYYRAIRTQTTRIAKIFFATCALVASSAIHADVIVTLGTMFTATETKIGAT